MDPNNMDAELASIVSSLSALSNNGLSQQQQQYQYPLGLSNNNNNINSNKQLGGFRSLSDNESDLFSQSSTSYLDQHVNNNNNNNGFAFGSVGYNKQSTYSVGTAPPYFSAYNNNNNNPSSSSSSSSSAQLINKLNLLDTYSNNLNLNTFNSSFNNNTNNTNNNNTTTTTTTSNNNNNNNNNFSNSNLSCDKENCYAHTIQNITTSNSNTGFFEKFGKSLIEGTKQLENENSLLNNNSNRGVNGSATTILNNQNVWNDSFIPSYQQPNNNDNDNNNNNNTTNATNSTTTNGDPSDILPKNNQLNSPPPFFLNRPILNNGFLYGNFSQFPMGSPTSFIPQMLYPLNQNPSLQSQIPSIEKDNKNNNLTGVSNPYSLTASTSLPAHKLPVNNQKIIESNIPILNNKGNIDTNGIIHDSNNSMGLQNVPMMFVPPSSRKNKNNTVNNKHARNKNNRSDFKGINFSDPPKFPIASNNATINSGNPYLDPHNTPISPSFINKLNESMNNANLDYDEPVKRKTTTVSSQQNSNFHRFPLLEEIKNNSDNKYTLKNIVGHTLEFCKDQYGSRFIQKELATVEPSEKEVIFNELRDHILPLSNDVFGNYVIQKFFQYGTPTQRSILVENFKGKMKELSVQMYACRVIQKALEFIKPEERIELVVELSDCVLKMIKDQNGNHVIQKAIECIPIESLPFILSSLIGHIYHLSTHSYGCRVIQRLLEFGTIKDQTVILNELKDFIPYLLQDQYGNYVIQHILQHGSDDINCLPMINTKQEIIDIVADNVVEFSKHKFASNVVEKAILYGTKEQKDSIISRILPRNKEHAANLEDNAPLILMMRDQFANYVVQKLVTVSEGESKILIVTAIKAYVHRLNSPNSLGNRHLASVEKLAALVENI